MPYCAVVGCKTGNKMPGRIQYQQFSLPATKGMRAKWLENINRDFTPTPHTRICAKHFKASDFVPQNENLDAHGKPKKKMTMKTSAIPSLFLKDPKPEAARGTKNSAPVLEVEVVNQDDQEYMDHLHTYSKPPETEPEQEQPLPEVKFAPIYSYFL